MPNGTDFKTKFKELTGHPPLSWQKRLYKLWAAKDTADQVSVIDLPTGLGKTMVIPIWLIARESNPDLGNRLVYVVDRRTVVDQATELVKDILKRIKQSIADQIQILKEVPAVSTLRGQLADNREWSRDPSRPAIIIGTIDLIGSALLFSGYRTGFKYKPLEAGLLGQDSLLILDEAHLSKPFEKLIKEIGDKGKYQKDREGESQGIPMRVVTMSATSGESADNGVFRLDTDINSPTYDLWSEMENGQEKNPIKKRFEAEKHLTIKPSDEVLNKIATEALDLAKDNPGSRIVIFVRSPKNVDTVRKEILKKDKSRNNQIAQLTGTMRGHERDELVTPPTQDDQHERRVMQRFLKPENDPSQGECFLISTSAGEVGFDLNADHMVCDAAPLDSMIQRLGRVNRRGLGNATVILVRENTPKDDSDFNKACIKTLELLKDTQDVSPEALADFKKDKREQIKTACTPEPTMVELTDILLDAWSMTSIIEPMPGRPEVGPWIRGVAEDLPQTTIAWRAELDLEGFSNLDIEEIEEWFDAHRVLTHETLSAPTKDVLDWFVKRWGNLTPEQQEQLVAKPVIVDCAGIEKISVKTLVDQLSRKNDASIRNAQLILPASFGGITVSGMLRMLYADGDDGKPDVADLQPEKRDNVDPPPERVRYRELITRNEDGEETIQLIGNATKPTNLQKPSVLPIKLQSDDEKTVRLVSYTSKSEKYEQGTEPQTLKEHDRGVCEFMSGILEGLALSENIKQAAMLAAEYHDYGKDRGCWQDALIFPKGFVRPAEPMAKSGKGMKPVPRGYRHEFGSLREFIDAKSGKVSEEVFDLAMHLIAAHHGRARPHFPKGGFDPACENRSDEIHTQSIQRFARLQRKYGWWRLAWLENLLRCADALASQNEQSQPLTPGDNR